MFGLVLTPLCNLFSSLEQHFSNFIYTNHLGSLARMLVLIHYVWGAWVFAFLTCFQSRPCHFKEWGLRWSCFSFLALSICSCAMKGGAPWPLKSHELISKSVCHPLLCPCWDFWCHHPLLFLEDFEVALSAPPTATPQLSPLQVLHLPITHLLPSPLPPVLSHLSLCDLFAKPVSPATKVS